MRIVPVKCRDGTIDYVPVYNLSDFPWDDLSPLAFKTRRKIKKPEYYLREFVTFDIETTSIAGDEPYGFMYHWQMCIAGKILCGRTWDECMEAFEKLEEIYRTDITRNLVVYVQNLGFEFQFMTDFIADKWGWNELFAVKSRKPLRALAKNGLQFRCSYLLSNMSLEYMTKLELKVKHLKQVGDLDYDKVRTPSTYLTDEEMSYCICDVLGLWEYINARMEDEGDNLESIPMTSTGYIRRKCRRASEKETGYRDMFKSLKMTKQFYEICKEAARGGDTHANRHLSGKIIEGVESYDVQSSYPYVMCCKKFPMTKFEPYGAVETRKEFNELLETKACLFRVLVENVRVKEEFASPYLSESKCIKYGKPVLDNGRILKASFIYAAMTDIDWEIFREQYTFDETTLTIGDMYIADYGYLPESIRKVIIELFRAKSELKSKRDKYDKDSEEYSDLDYQYGKTKNLLNGIFGMMYTDPVRATIIWNGEEWKEEKPDIQKSLDKFWNSRNSFLYYPWGIWTTAHARKHLAELVKAAGNENVIYCDTDSAKGADFDIEAIEKMNESISKEARDHEAYAYVDGTYYDMGIYDHDESYERFITLGAKKYAYEKKGKLHITISGVRKGGADELKNLENFKTGFIFTESAGNEFRYNASNIHTINLSGEKIKTASNIAVLPGTYTIGITKEYEDLIGYNID